MKSSPHLGPMKVPPTTNSQTSPVQRSMMNRQQAARSNATSVVSPLQLVNTMMQSGHDNVYSQPLTYPRNHSQTSSPSASRPSDFVMQGGLSSPTSSFPTQQMHGQQRPQPRPQRNAFPQHSTLPRRVSGPSATSSGSIAGKPTSNIQTLPATLVDF